MQPILQNHVAIVLDRSGSMSDILQKAKTVLENLIKYLKEKSISFDQETRVSVYTFDNNVECIIYDMDVMRFKSFDSFRIGGRTALMDATNLAIEDLQKIPQTYFDHAFIIYVITDGLENASNIKPTIFKSKLKALPDNFTTIGFAPDVMSVQNLISLGFDKGNVDRWDATERGIEEVGQKISASIDRYFDMRSKGVRSSNTLISDLSSMTANTAKNILSKLDRRKYCIVNNNHRRAIEIRDLVEEQTGSQYETGRSFYELVKTEHIQAYKEIAIQHKTNNEVYTGPNARKLLGLPDHEVKIKPGDHGEWSVFVQSTSYNRKVIPNQKVLVLK